jgi:hypothetical protein
VKYRHGSHGATPPRDGSHHDQMASASAPVSPIETVIGWWHRTAVSA